jgi:Large eukaryotic DNA virus major capsid protein/Major capsid protein N-terminus
MQLVAYGAQDVYLTGQPKVTFFQAVYKRHTNFAMEAIQQTVNGTAGSNARVSVTIARNGDLVGDMWLSLQPSTYVVTTDNVNFDTCWIAERAVSAVELTIGGQRIDKHYQTWWRLYAEVFLGESDKIAYGKMTSSPITNASQTSTVAPARVYLPLLFFFNRNPGLFLPLIALQYHEVRLDFDLTGYYGNYFNDFQVWANYVYLDTEERRRFAQKGHEYLIEQVQHTGGDTVVADGSAKLVRLSFNHPVKELIWCYQNGSATSSTILNAMWNFSTGTGNVQATVTSNLVSIGAALPHLVGCPVLYSNGNSSSTSNVSWIEDGLPLTGSGASNYDVGPLASFKLILNGQDRFKEQLGKYFNQYVPFRYHTGTPYVGIYCYSFALQPEEHQPTGTCNFSRIDNAQVSVALKSGSVAAQQKLFAVNYNILRIQSGMGGLAFSN